MICVIIVVVLIGCSHADQDKILTITLRENGNVIEKIDVNNFINLDTNKMVRKSLTSTKKRITLHFEVPNVLGPDTSGERVAYCLFRSGDKKIVELVSVPYPIYSGLSSVTGSLSNPIVGELFVFYIAGFGVVPVKGQLILTPHDSIFSPFLPADTLQLNDSNMIDKVKSVRIPLSVWHREGALTLSLTTSHSNIIVVWNPEYKYNKYSAYLVPNDDNFTFDLTPHPLTDLEFCFINLDDFK